MFLVTGSLMSKASSESILTTVATTEPMSGLMFTVFWFMVRSGSPSTRYLLRKYCGCEATNSFTSVVYVGLRVLKVGLEVVLNSSTVPYVQTDGSVWLKVIGSSVWCETTGTFGISKGCPNP